MKHVNEQQQMAEDLKKLLREGEVEFEYKKLNGQTRPARGTLKMDMIPEEAHPTTGKPVIPNSINYYDLDKNAWRSFRIENLISIKHNEQ